MTEIYCVYRHYDADGILLYVGCTSNLPRRTASHRRVAAWKNRIAKITTKTFGDKVCALKHERETIWKLNPKFNRQFQPYFRKRLTRILQLKQRGYSSAKIGRLYKISKASVCFAVRCGEERNRGA